MKDVSLRKEAPLPHQLAGEGNGDREPATHTVWRRIYYATKHALILGQQ